MATKIVQSNTLYLSGSGVLVGATTIGLTSLTDIYGNVLTMTDFGSLGYITLEPDTTNEEAAIFTGITANANGTYSLTGVSTVLAKSPYTATSGLVRQHSGGTKVVITDSAAFWATFGNLNNDNVWTGNNTFNVAPVALSATPASTTVLGNVKLTSTPSTNLGNPTITIASPAVITLASHGLIAGDSVQFTTTGALPTGISASTNYYVISAGLTTNTFEISATVGGSAINTSGSQSGTHTLLRTTPFAVGNEDSRLPNATGAAFLNAVTGTVQMFAGTSTPTGFLACDGSAVSRSTYAALFAVIGTTWGAGDGSTTFNVPDLRGRAPIGKGVGTKVATISSVSTNVITATGLTNAANNEFQTGQAVLFTASVAGNLVTATTYYVVRTGNTTFSLATSLANAQNNTVITLAGTERGTLTLTLTTRTVGDTGGEENHAMNLNELIAHHHQVTGNASAASAASVGSANNNGTNTTFNTTDTGGNSAMNIMSPFAVINYIIKT